MSLLKTLEKRKLSIIGIFLIVMSIDFLLRDEAIFYNMSPMIGEIFPFVKIQQPTKTLPTFVVKLYSWPFYMPMILGGVLMAVDIGKIKKEREQTTIGLTEETVKW